MTTINGTITSANPGPALYSALETAMLADGWTLEDTVVIGGNTHKVLKSAAAGNAQGLDWYLDINFPTTGTTGGIRFAPFESYTAASDLGIRGPYTANVSTIIDATTYSRFAATGSALETNWSNSASYTGLSLPLTTGVFNYRVSVTRNRIIAMLTNNPNQIAYAGFFVPSAAHASHAGAALFPLIMAVFSSSASAAVTGGSAGTTSVALTRLPKLTSMLSNGWATYAIVPTSTAGIGGSPEGQVGVAVSPFTGRATLRPLPILINAQGTTISAPSTSTALLDEIGTIEDVACGYVSSSSIRDDSVTIGSDTWYDVTPSASSTLFFRGI
jgi:hypothetical protein